MKVSKWKQMVFLLLAVCLATSYGLTGCGDDSLDAEPATYSGNLVQADPPTIDDYVGTWSGTLEGVLQGMAGTVSITVANSSGLLSGTMDVTQLTNTPADVTISGAVGAGDTDPLAGIYTYSLIMNDSPVPSGCLGWNVVGAGTLNEAKTEMSITGLGIFCNTSGIGSLGISSGVLTKQ